MCQYAHLRDGGLEAQNKARWNDFRTLYLQYMADTKNEVVDKEDKTKLRQHLHALRREVLSRAAAVCCTVTNAASEAVKAGCKHSARIGMIDEAGRILEYVSLPVLLTQFSDLGSWVLLGDSFQLKPIIFLIRKEIHYIVASSCF